MICYSSSVYLRSYVWRHRIMNTGFWEQRLGRDIQTNAHLLLISTSVKVKECASVPLCVWAPSSCYREANEDLSVEPVLLLSTLRATDHPYVPIPLLISAFSCSEHFIHPLKDIPWVQNSLRSHLWPLLFFSVNHRELLVTSLLFSVLCCCCRQHEIDKEWHWEELKGHFSSFDASDTCSYKKGNGYHKHIAGWCRRWMIIWK